MPPAHALFKAPWQPGNAWLAATASCLALATPAAHAAGSAVLQNEGKATTVQWLDAQTLRSDTAGEDGWLLLRDDKIYGIGPDEDSGELQSIEFGGIFQGLLDAFDASDVQMLPGTIESMRATDETQTVAGIRGNVYDAILRDKDGRIQHERLVLTDNPLVVEFTDAWLASMGAMVGAERMASVRQALDGRGLLRLGDETVLQSISAEVPDAALFDLPSEPLPLQDLLKKMVR